MTFKLLFKRIWWIEIPNSIRCIRYNDLYQVIDLNVYLFIFRSRKPLNGVQEHVTGILMEFFILLFYWGFFPIFYLNLFLGLFYLLASQSERISRQTAIPLNNPQIIKYIETSSRLFVWQILHESPPIRKLIAKYIYDILIFFAE